MHRRHLATSTSTPTTCSPRTSGSPPPPSTRRSAAHRKRPAAEDHRALVVDGLRERHRLPDARGRRSASARRRSRPTASRSSRTEYFAQGACEQYGLPYTIVRPFNCVGIGERRRARRQGGHARQRQAGDEPRRARPGPEGAQGPGPAAHPRRRASRCATTPTAATWRAASALCHRAPGGAQRGLQPLDRRSRRPCWSWPS